jgi:hypothetical protein
MQRDVPLAYRCANTRKPQSPRKGAHISTVPPTVSSRHPEIIHPKVSSVHLSRIRLQPAIYFCLHRGSLPKNTAGRQPRFGLPHSNFTDAQRKYA